MDVKRRHLHQMCCAWPLYLDTARTGIQWGVDPSKNGAYVENQSMKTAHQPTRLGFPPHWLKKILPTKGLFGTVLSA